MRNEQHTHWLKDARPQLLLMAVLISFVWSLISLAIIDARKATESDSQRESEAMVNVIGEQVLRAITAVDYALSFVAYELAENAEPGQLAKLVDRGAVRMNTLVLLSHVDGKGWLQQTNNGRSQTPIDLSDREHIRVHFAPANVGFFIGKPVLGRASGQWSIQMSRAIRTHDGIVTGVVVASMDPRYFEQFWTGAQFANFRRIELIGTDGVLRASSSNVQAEFNAAVPRPEIARLAMQQSIGRLSMQGALGQQPSSTFFHRVEGLPLVITATSDPSLIEATLAPIRVHYLGLGSAATAAILVLGLILSQRTKQLFAQRRFADLARQRLRDAIEAMPDGFALFDNQDRLVLFNSAYQQIYTTSGDSIREGATFEEIVRHGASVGQYPEAVGRLDEWVGERVRAHRDPMNPFEQQTNDGRWLRIEERRTNDGGIVGIRADITRIKERELALASQTALLTTTFEHMSDGLTLVGGNGELIAWNRKFSELFSLPQSVDAQGASLCELLAIFGQNDHVIHDFDKADAELAFKRSLAEPDLPVEWRGPDGQIIEMKSARLPDGGAITIYANVTQRRRDEQRTRRSEAQKSAMVATALDGVIVTDGLGYVLEYNTAAQNIFGWTAAEAIGGSISNLFNFEISEPNAGAEQLLGHASSLVPGRLNELQAIDRSGRRFPVEVSMSEISLESGRIFSAYIRDISDRKRAEEEMTEARTKAEAANRAKSEFLAMVSHEVRTPMNGIIGLTNLLMGTKLDPQQQRFAKGIDESANRLLKLINEILEFSRIEAGRLIFELSAFDLVQLADSAVDTTKVLLGDKPVTVTADIAADVPTLLMGDANRIYQVAHNLLANSAKFTQQGNIDLRIRQVTGVDAKVRLRFEVSDSGPGISPDVLDKLFVPFEQGATDVARRYGGSGLGLAICRRLVELMEGSIGVESTPGAGSTFWFEIELQRAAGLPARPPALPDRAPSRRMHILVAEDTPTSQLVIRSMIERLGHSVQVVSDGAEAVKALTTTAFDLVLLDLQMPIMGGIEATHCIRNLPSPACAVFVAALTAQAHRGVEEQTLAAGMNGFLTKPITIDRLNAVICDASDRCQMEQLPLLAVDDGVAALHPSPMIDTNALEDLRQSVGDDAFKQLLQQFNVDCASALADMAAVLRSSDREQLRKAAHKLSGLFGQFGRPAAAALAQELETETMEQRRHALGEQLMAFGQASLAAS